MSQHIWFFQKDVFTSIFLSFSFRHSYSSVQSFDLYLIVAHLSSSILPTWSTKVFECLWYWLAEGTLSLGVALLLPLCHLCRGYFSCGWGEVNMCGVCVVYAHVYRCMCTCLWRPEDTSCPPLLLFLKTNSHWPWRLPFFS